MGKTLQIVYRVMILLIVTIDTTNAQGEDITMIQSKAVTFSHDALDGYIILSSYPTQCS